VPRGGGCGGHLGLGAAGPGECLNVPLSRSVLSAKLHPLALCPALRRVFPDFVSHVFPAQEDGVGDGSGSDDDGGGPGHAHHHAHRAGPSPQERNERNNFVKALVFVVYKVLPYVAVGVALVRGVWVRELNLFSIGYVVVVGLLYRTHGTTMLTDRRRRLYWSVLLLYAFACLVARVLFQAPHFAGAAAPNSAQRILGLNKVWFFGRADPVPASWGGGHGTGGTTHYPPAPGTLEFHPRDMTGDLLVFVLVLWCKRTLQAPTFGYVVLYHRRHRLRAIVHGRRLAQSLERQRLKEPVMILQRIFID